MPRQKSGLLKKYPYKSLYYKFYYLPLLMLLLVASYGIYLCLKGFKIGRYLVIYGRQYVCNP